jgi:Xaa-Pro aminopeptidase
MDVIGAGPGDDEPPQAEMVFAIEPVLYSKQQNFAVFLEHVVLVTNSGYDVLSRGMPYTVEEVETVMRQKSVIEAADHR